MGAGAAQTLMSPAPPPASACGCLQQSRRVPGVPSGTRCPEAAASSSADAQDAERDPRPTPTASPRAEPQDAPSPANKVAVCS